MGSVVTDGTLMACVEGIVLLGVVVLATEGIGTIDVVVADVVGCGNDDAVVTTIDTGVACNANVCGGFEGVGVAGWFASRACN